MCHIVAINNTIRVDEAIWVQNAILIDAFPEKLPTLSVKIVLTGCQRGTNVPPATSVAIRQLGQDMLRTGLEVIGPGGRGEQGVEQFHSLGD